jgi:hypothetical protein
MNYADTQKKDQNCWSYEGEGIPAQRLFLYLVIFGNYSYENIYFLLSSSNQNLKRIVQKSETWVAFPAIL